MQQCRERYTLSLTSSAITNSVVDILACVFLLMWIECLRAGLQNLRGSGLGSEKNQWLFWQTFIWNLAFADFKCRQQRILAIAVAGPWHQGESLFQISFQLTKVSQNIAYELRHFKITVIVRTLLDFYFHGFGEKTSIAISKICSLNIYGCFKYNWLCVAIQCIYHLYLYLYTYASMYLHIHIFISNPDSHDKNGRKNPSLRPTSTAGGGHISSFNRNGQLF
jgi:hypothetical protein